MFVGVLDRLGNLSSSQDCNPSSHIWESGSLSSYMSDTFIKFVCVCALFKKTKQCSLFIPYNCHIFYNF